MTISLALVFKANNQKRKKRKRKRKLVLLQNRYEGFSWKKLKKKVPKFIATLL
jgi:hypothetical protein